MSAGWQFAAVLAMALVNAVTLLLHTRRRAEGHAQRAADLLEDQGRLKQECDSLQRALLEVPASAPRSVPCMRAAALKPETFCRVWREWPEDDERFLAVQQLLALEIVTAVDRVSDVRLAGRPGEMAHAAGGLEHLLALAANLDTARVNPEQWVGNGRNLKRRDAETQRKIQNL